MASSDDESLGKMILKRKQNGSAVANPKPKTPIAKKEKADNDFGDDDDKPIAKTIPRKAAPVKKEVKKEEKSSISKPDKNVKRKREDAVAAATPEKKKREKKVYDLPGQKRDTPEERDSLRIFYETLYEQIPTSEMAQVWMMESGLISKEEAQKVFEKKQNGRQLQKVSSPSKSVASVRKTTAVVKKTTTSVTVKKKTTSTPVSSNKKKPTTPASKASKSRKKNDESSKSKSDDVFVSDRDDYVTPKKKKAA